MDAKGSQNTQNSQVERLISLGCDALCINSVDRSSASIIIDKAMDAGTPVVFFNREPVEEDMNRWEKLYYVGADAKESAVLQGDILVDAYRRDSRTLDANGNGLVSYVLLEGRDQPPGFPDPHGVVYPDLKGRGRSVREDYRRNCQLGQKPGISADGTVAEGVSGTD